MSNRPNDPVLVWSSDDTYPAGAEDWQTAPDNTTKIKPGSGKIAEGFEPNESPPAQWMNYALNRCTAFAAYLDRIDVKNWRAPIEIGSDVGSTPGEFAAWTGSGVSISNNGVVRLAISHEGSHHPRRLLSSDEGFTFDDAAIRGTDYEGAVLSAWNDGGGEAIVLVVQDVDTPGGVPYIISFQDGAWSTSHRNLNRDYYSLAWVDRESMFFTTGLNRATNHGCAQAVVVGEPFPNVVGPLFDSGSTLPIKFQASSPECTVIGDGAGHLWRSASIDTDAFTAVDTLSAFTFGLAYWDGPDQFVAVCAGGIVFLSDDGITWGQSADVSADWTFTGAVAASGGTLLAEAINASNGYYELISSVDGMTWERMCGSPIQARYDGATDYSADFAWWQDLPYSVLVARKGRFYLTVRISVRETRFACSLRV